MDKLSLCLWFNGQAEEAAKFYTSVFADSKILETSRYGEAGPGPKGSVMTVSFQAAGLKILALNGGPEYKFTPALSLVATCKDQREIDDVWEKLLQGGQAMQCGWLTDKYGVSWQVVPEGIGKLIKSTAAMKAMMGMIKLDIQKLKDAA